MLDDNPFANWHAYHKPQMRKEEPQQCQDCARLGTIFQGGFYFPYWLCKRHHSARLRRDNKWGGHRNWGHQRNG